MPPMERRFVTGFRQVDRDAPGLVLENDGTVWLVNPGGSRTQLPGGGGGGCAYFTCDTGEETASVDAPNGVSVTAPQVSLGAAAPEGGGNAVVTAMASTADEESVASFEAGYNEGDGQGYANVSALSPDGEHSAGLSVTADNTEAQATVYGETATVTAVTQISLISTATEVAQNPAVFAGASDPDVANRAYVEAGVSGNSDEGTFARLISYRKNGTGAIAELLSEVGGDSSYYLDADKISLGAGQEPISRPAVDPNTVTPEQLANALISVGLLVST